MTKKEFLKVLQTSLSGKISDVQVAEHLRFYEEYINNEIAGGRTEEEVLAGLGDPRLIARTILTTEGGDNQTSGGSARGNSGYNDNREDRQANIRVTRFPAWIWLIVVLLVVVLVVGAIFSVVSFLLPFLVPILFVALMIKLFRDWLN